MVQEMGPSFFRCFAEGGRGVVAWGLEQYGFGHDGPHPSMLAPTSVGDLLKSRSLDTTSVAAFSVPGSVLGVGFHRVGSADTGTSLPAVSGDSGAALETSGGSSTAAVHDLATAPWEVFATGYSGPTPWTGPSIVDLHGNFPLLCLLAKLVAHSLHYTLRELVNSLFSTHINPEKRRS